MDRSGNGRLRFSATDLVTYLACRHASHLDVPIFSKDRTKSGETETTQLLKRKSIAHQRAYLGRLKAGGKSIAEIKQGLGLSARADSTLAAMVSGVEIVYKAVLYAFPWKCEADFLQRCDRPSALGDYSYEIADTTLARTADPKHIIKLCVYSELLARLQGIAPENMQLVLGTGEYQSFRFDEFYYYYTSARLRFERWIENLPNESYPERCAHCELCQWREHCTHRWQEDDHLSRVANIRRSELQNLQRVGIYTVAGLANTEIDMRIPEMTSEGFLRLRAQAVLQTRKAKTGKDFLEHIPITEGKGLSRLPRPSGGDLFFDMEGDPLYPDGLEYLFGVVSVEGKQERFNAFWAHDHLEEKQAFIDFMAFVENHFERYPRAYIYHYNHYETTALKRLSGRYGVCEERLDNLLRGQRFVDLYQVVREAIRTSEPGYSIKNLETFYMERVGEVMSAEESVVVYNEWQETGKNKLLKKIAEYNEEDCVSTWKLRNWLVSFRTEATPWFGETGEEESSPPLRKEWELEYERYQHLLGVFQEDLSEDRQQISDLLEFHNREAKTEWWGAFDRRDRSVEELIEDAECIGGLEWTGEAPVPDKRSLVWTYRFPPQTFKLKTGDQVVETGSMNPAGTIFDIGEERGLVRIKMGPKVMPLEGRCSVGPSGPVDSRVIRGALYRFADRLLESPTVPNAALDLLRRAPPRIKGRESGEPIVKGSGSQEKAYLEAVSGLDNSYLFIQGPPGSGKTYTSGHLIVSLIAQGHKIGITSNSHKAIHNLLDMVVGVAEQKGVAFQGIKKCSTGNPETIYRHRFIENTDKTEKINLSAELFAGTAWLFSHPHFAKQLDYLFIDEAGQVATANVIGMASSTRNIILVGDQMQLGQPLKGTHPGEAGMSVLRYLLQSQDTIPPDRGIFLGLTWRLRPSICRFISDAFYEGRLKNHPVTVKRTLALEATDLPNEGVVMISINHSGCSQKSVEEAGVIKSHYDDLLGQSFTDSEGLSRILSIEDILVVSPYNVQVNYLQKLLPEGARVGTVDKFQGQEAPVVIVSMVTSTAEDLPRNMEFLFSRNRLNVAVSRAQCLAVVVLNPRLLEAPCKTIDQMKLVNVFCRLENYADKLNADKIIAD